MPAEKPVEHTLTVVGSGKVTAEPDIARILFSVGGERFDTLAKARTDAAERTRRCLAALATAGIAERDRRTGAFVAGPEFEWRKGRQETVGYAVRNVLRVTVRDIGAAGEVVDAVMAAGASSLTGPTFEVEDDAALRIAARTTAVRDARAAADALAEALGVKITGVGSVSPGDGGAWGQPGPQVAYFRMAAADASPETPIEAGTLEVAASVQVTFLIG